MYEEPAPVAANSAGSTGANGNGPTDAGTATTADKAAAKDKLGSTSEVPEGSSSQSNLLDELAPRKRTRVVIIYLPTCKIV